MKDCPPSQPVTAGAFHDTMDTGADAGSRCALFGLWLMSEGADLVQIRMLESGDEQVLANVADDVFDHDIQPRWTAEFLNDPRHHLAVALDDGVVVGFASAVHYIHPDKSTELWINEVGVAPTHHKRGLGRRLVQALLAEGRKIGCGEAWVLTEPDNVAANQLYRSLGGLDSQAIMYNFKLTADGR